jgi:hypothetical protein
LGGDRSEPRAPKILLLLDHEQQKNCDQKRENPKAFGERNADKHPSKLPVGRSRVTQCAQEKLTKNYANADRGRSRADCGQSCTY